MVVFIQKLPKNLLVLPETSEYVIKNQLGIQVHLLTDFCFGFCHYWSDSQNNREICIHTNMILIELQNFLIFYITWQMKKWNALVLNIWSINGFIMPLRQFLFGTEGSFLIVRPTNCVQKGFIIQPLLSLVYIKDLTQVLTL